MKICIKASVMREYIIFSAILLALPLCLNAQKDDNGPDICDLIQEYNRKVIYTDVKPIRGIVFRIDEGDREYLPGNREFHRLLSTTPLGEEHIANYNKFTRIAKPLALAGTAITVADIAWYVRDRNAPRDQPLLFWGSLALGQVLNFSAGYFSARGQNALHNAVREYNLNIVPVNYQMNNNNFSSLQLRIECKF